MRRTNVRGHALRSEGKSYGPSRDDPSQFERWRGHIGYGLCECGAHSDCEWSNAARQRWHATHKAEVKATS
jgi:hypothetical protein